MAFEKPLELIRFVSNIRILEDGTVPTNQLEMDNHFVSEMYEPLYSVSVLGRVMNTILIRNEIEETNHDLEPHTIVYQALNSRLADVAPEIYLLLRVTVLESFALVYHIDEQRKALTYVSDRDLFLIKNNMNYIADYFSTNEEFYHMIDTIRHMVISLGYIQHQVDVMINETGGR